MTPICEKQPIFCLSKSQWNVGNHVRCLSSKSWQDLGEILVRFRNTWMSWWGLGKVNGRFQKISVPYHGRLLWIPRARGFFELEFRRHGGILTSGILKAGWVRSGIYTGDRQEFIPWKLFFMDVLNQFVNRAQTSNISSLTMNNCG